MQTAPVIGLAPDPSGTGRLLRIVEAPPNSTISDVVGAVTYGDPSETPGAVTLYARSQCVGSPVTVTTRYFIAPGTSEPQAAGGWAYPASTPGAASGSGLPDPVGVLALPTAALTTNYDDSTTAPIAVGGFANIDIQGLYTDTGGAALASVTYLAQWSMLASPGTMTDADWCNYLREEFTTDPTPTNNGVGIESDYEAQYPIPAAALPFSYGVTLPVKGCWFRIKAIGDGTVANVARSLYYMRRTT